VSADGEILERVEGGVLRLTLSNPAKRNALTPTMLAGLERILIGAAGDERVRVIVLRGAGDVFSSGYALGSFPTGADLHEDDELTAAVNALARSPKTTLAVLNGNAIGAALDLALAADFRVAVAGSRVGLTPARFGIIYPWQGIQRAVHELGIGMARRLLLTAELVPVEELAAAGVAQEIAESFDDLDAAVRRWVEVFLRTAPRSVAGTKAVLDIVQERTPTEAERARILALRREAIDSRDAAEAMRAFAERRRPVFTGR